MDEPLVTISKEVMSGAPVFFGTRVPIQALVDYLAVGHNMADFLSDFPSVKREQAVRLLTDGAARLIAAAAE